MQPCKRLFLLLPMLLLACVGSQPAEAGVILDNNGIVTQYSDTFTGHTYYFYEGSYDTTLSTSQTTLSLSSTEQFYYGLGLVNDLADYSGTTTPARTVSYVLATATSGTNVVVNEVYPVDSTNWGFGSGRSYSTSATTSAPSESNTFYFASLTDPTSGSTSNVPEPSTALAMGLLGVLGFAGNRRRRRQS
ncbi:MAG: PEP-CTERM sorting domain-containing protein [Rubripirellula sp.]